jgi:hypothetical protein
MHATREATFGSRSADPKLVNLSMSSIGSFQNRSSGPQSAGLQLITIKTEWPALLALQQSF